MHLLESFLFKDIIIAYGEGNSSYVIVMACYIRSDGHSDIGAALKIRMEVWTLASPVDLKKLKFALHVEHIGTYLQHKYKVSRASGPG